MSLKVGVSLRDWGYGGKEEMLAKKYKAPVIRWIISGGLMYSIIIIVDNIILNI